MIQLNRKAKTLIRPHACCLSDQGIRCPHMPPPKHAFTWRSLCVNHIPLNGPRQAKKCLRTCAFQSPCACAKYHPGLCSPFIHSVVLNDSSSGQWRPWSDCADAQADLGLRCPHMPEDTFSQGETRKVFVLLVGPSDISADLNLS